MTYQAAEATYSAVFPKIALRVQTLEGSVACAAGDAVVTGSQGESWPVQRDDFFRKYTPNPGVVLGEDGQYTKRLAFVEARRLHCSETIRLNDERGILAGEIGDWCVTYGLNNQAFVRADIFERSYLHSKSITVRIGVKSILALHHTAAVVAAELALRKVLPHTPVVFVLQDTETKFTQPLWFKVTDDGAIADSHSSVAVLSLPQISEQDNVKCLLSEIGRLQKQSVRTFTLDRLRSLVTGFFNDPAEAGEMVVIAAQLFEVNEFNSKLQADDVNEYFIGSVPESLDTRANGDLRRVGSVADLLAGVFQKKWQQLMLADSKAIACVKSTAVFLKPFAIIWLFLGGSIVTLGMLAALGLASFSELAEGCDSVDWFVWIGCSTEGWKHWMGFIAFAVYISALVVAWLRFASAKVSRFESMHQDYRLLAECLRVQYVLSALGVDTCIAEDFAEGKNTQSSWVLLALRSLTGDKSHRSANCPKDSDVNEWAMKAFVNDQVSYHETTLIKRREDAIAVLSSIGRFGAGAFLLFFVLLIINVTSKLLHHDDAIFSPVGQHFLLILQVAGLAIWGSMRKVIDTFGFEQEVQRGLVVLSVLRRATKNDRESIVTAAKSFAQDQATWHALRRSRPVEATTGGG